MDKYFNLFREMISLRGLSDHTLLSYCTYIRSYLDYLERILKKNPEDVSWVELRNFIRWLQNDRNLSDRTVNTAIAQLRFFTIYVLHKPWVDSQLPKRRFDSYLPFVPSQKDTWIFISSIQDLRFKAIVSLMYSSGLRSGEVRHLKYSDISRKDMRIHVLHSKSRNDRYAPLSSYALSILTEYWFAYNKLTGSSLLTGLIKMVRLFRSVHSICLPISVTRKRLSVGNTGSPHTLSGILSLPICTRMVRTF